MIPRSGSGQKVAFTVAGLSLTADAVLIALRIAGVLASVPPAFSLLLAVAFLSLGLMQDKEEDKVPRRLDFIIAGLHIVHFIVQLFAP